MENYPIRSNAKSWSARISNVVESIIVEQAFEATIYLQAGQPMKTAYRNQPQPCSGINLEEIGKRKMAGLIEHQLKVVANQLGEKGINNGHILIKKTTSEKGSQLTFEGFKNKTLDTALVYVAFSI